MENINFSNSPISFNKPLLNTKVISFNNQWSNISPIIPNSVFIPTRPIAIDEIWIAVTDRVVENIKPGYHVSNYGRVFSLLSGKMLVPNINRKGYFRMTLQLITGASYTVSVHRVALLAFNYVSNYKELHVNHKDGVKTNNYLGNLEWVTPGQNTLHAYANGLTPTGKSYEMHNEFTDELAHKTCQLYLQGHSMTQISIMLNCGMHGIFNLLHGKSRKHISCQYDIKVRDTYVFNDEQKTTLLGIFDEFFTMYPNGEISGIYKYICRMLNVEYDETIRRAIRRVYNRDYLKNK